MRDERGEIPAFPPIRADARGRVVPMSEAERAARMDALTRVVRAIGRCEDKTMS